MNNTNTIITFVYNNVYNYDYDIVDISIIPDIVLDVVNKVIKTFFPVYGKSIIQGSNLVIIRCRSPTKISLY